jgi:hypothetical protein
VCTNGTPKDCSVEPEHTSKNIEKEKYEQKEMTGGSRVHMQGDDIAHMLTDRNLSQRRIAMTEKNKKNTKKYKKISIGCH